MVFLNPSEIHRHQTNLFLDPVMPQVWMHSIEDSVQTWNNGKAPRIFKREANKQSKKEIKEAVASTALLKVNQDLRVLEAREKKGYKAIPQEQ